MNHRFLRFSSVFVTQTVSPHQWAKKCIVETRPQHTTQNGNTMTSQKQILIDTIKTHLKNVGERTDGQLLFDVGKTLHFPENIGTFCGHDVCNAARLARLEIANEKPFKPAPMLFSVTLRHPKCRDIVRYVALYRLDASCEFDDMMSEFGWSIHWAPTHSIPESVNSAIVLF
jgi:hypothetical protein